MVTADNSINANLKSAVFFYLNTKHQMVKTETIPKTAPFKKLN